MPIPFNKWCWDSNIHRQKNEVALFISHHIQKMNWKWIKNLNVRANIIKFPEENIEVNLHNLELGNEFLGLTTKA